MIIVIEGPDNAGKTTLCQVMAKRLNAIYIKAERPRAGPDLLIYQSILERAVKYSGCVIADRHVAISEPIYGNICRGGHQLSGQDIALCLSRIDLVVFCRPDMNTIMGTLGTREHMAGVQENSLKIVQAYDDYFTTATQEWTGVDPTLMWYRFTDGPLATDQFIETISIRLQQRRQLNAARSTQ